MQTNTDWFHFHELPRIVTFIGKKVLWSVPGAREGVGWRVGMGNWCLTGTEFQFKKVKNPRDGWLWKWTYWAVQLNMVSLPWWERKRAGGEGDDGGWDSWMASLTQWTWVWASSRRWWGIGKPDVLQSTWSQRLGHNQATEQQQNLFYF